MSFLENLLFRGESESLDFKRDQYPFIGATDDQKGKLLKDVLAMANAWRTETAHILIGVDAPAGAAPSVVGITQSLDDAALQQFVNAKTQRPVEFRYFETDLAGRRVGVIEIPVQRRPLYTGTNFGGVRANAVYTRRGSSNAEANPDEIARMGAATPELEGSELQVVFAAPGSRQLLGPSATLECTDIALDEEGDIPNYEEEPGGFRFGSLTDNRDYWRELVDFIKTTQLARPVALAVSNRGKSAAREVRVELKIEDAEKHLTFIKKSEMPAMPSKRSYLRAFSAPNAIAAAIKVPPFEAEYVDGAWHIAFNLGTLQPARTVFPAIPFFAGSKQSKLLEITGRVLADNLPSPAECKLTFRFNSTQKAMNLESFEDEYSKLLADGFADE